MKLFNRIEDFVVQESDFLQELFAVIVYIVTGIGLGILLPKEETLIFSIVMILAAMPICQRSRTVGDYINGFLAPKLSRPQGPEEEALEEEALKSKLVFRVGEMMLFMGLGLSAIKPEHDRIEIGIFVFQVLIFFAIIQYSICKTKELPMDAEDNFLSRS